jgi:xanthine dehydrogenase accessory factor
MPLKVLVRGGGDLASGVIYRLIRAGWQVIDCELPKPLSVRRLVCFSQAVYDGVISIEGIEGRLAHSPEDALQIANQGRVAVLVDPMADIRRVFAPQVYIDARMTKRPPDLGIDTASLVIGLGPGFIAGENCHAVIETIRGPEMGRVIWQGQAQPDTGKPDVVANHQGDRVLRAPRDGMVEACAQIGAEVQAGQVVMRVGGEAVTAAFEGILRGQIQSGLVVERGVKIGDVDPRIEPALSTTISDKALAVGGGVLEAILSRADLRQHLWD